MKIDQKKLPSRVLYVLVGLIVVIFALFWLIGYNRPFDEDGNFNAPLFTDVLLVFMMLLTVGAFAVAVWSAIRSNKDEDQWCRLYRHVLAQSLRHVRRYLAADDRRCHRSRNLWRH